MWHKTRVEDCAFADASGEEQLWISDKWHEKFGMEPNPGQMGFGDSLEQVMSLECTKENLLGYADSVRARASSVLKTISSEDLDKKISATMGQTIEIGDYLGRVAADNIQHGGQICYLRGFITGFGWLPTNPGRRSDLDFARLSGESRNPERMGVDMRGVSCPLIDKNVVRKKDKGETTGFRHAPE